MCCAANSAFRRLSPLDKNRSIIGSRRRLPALTHLPEDIGAAADVAQQLGVGDGHVLVR